MRGVDFLIKTTNAAEDFSVCIRCVDNNKMETRKIPKMFSLQWKCVPLERKLFLWIVGVWVVIQCNSCIF